MRLSQLLPVFIAPAALACADLEIVECTPEEAAWISAGVNGTKSTLLEPDGNGNSQLDMQMEDDWDGSINTTSQELYDVLTNEVTTFACGVGKLDNCPNGHVEDDGTCTEAIAMADLLHDRIVYNVDYGIFQAAVETHEKIRPILENYTLDQIRTMCDDEVTKPYSAFLSFRAGITDDTTHEAAHFPLGLHSNYVETHPEATDEIYQWGYSAGDVAQDKRMEIMCTFPNVLCGEDGSVKWFHYKNREELRVWLTEQGAEDDFICE